MLKVMLVNTSPQPPTGLWDVLGWSLWCSGFLLEAVLAPGRGKAGLAPGRLDPMSGWTWRPRSQMAKSLLFEEIHQTGDASLPQVYGDTRDIQITLGKS